MTRTISIDPVTRVEGHISVSVERDDTLGTIQSARSSGTLFRGFEILLQGKDPRDAIHITQRVCGVCPVSHAMASALAIEAAAGVEVPANARRLRNLILGADFIHSHILHFYHLAALSYVQGPAMPPWTPGYAVDLRLSPAENQTLVDHYVQALAVRRQAHEMGAIFSGRLPHTVAYEYGGVTCVPDQARIDRFRSKLTGIISFIDDTYLPDVELLGQAYPDYYAIGTGYGNLLAFGVFDLDAAGTTKLLPRGRVAGASQEVQTIDLQSIVEETEFAWYDSRTSGRNPAQGETVPQAGKIDAYSWIKAPRYDGVPYETGPLARMWMAGDYRRGVSVMDRHVARALETRKIAYAMQDWLNQLEPGSPVFVRRAVPSSARGVGLSEAPRGALGHWLSIAGGKIDNYQILTPTCWNCSPRDQSGQPGPLEKSLEGAPLSDATQPVEALRVVQSYDPCLACAVH